MSRLLSAAGALVDRIKINVLSRELRDGRPYWIKRRQWTARPVLICANRFFDLVGNPIQALADPFAWQAWEVECFLRLHGGNFHAGAEGSRAVVAEEVPGRSLSHHLTTQTLTLSMLRAGAAELRRAHTLECSAFRGAWSHGDAHLGNFVFDELTNRARLIDFEVRHHPKIPANERHADDLLIFLQDLMGRTSAAQWLPQAQSFLDGYACAEVLPYLRERLVPPRGLAHVWWAVRTTYLAPAELTRRLAALRAAL
jgi:hypothetical protein